MAKKTIAELKALWVTGYVPTQSDFDDLFDSTFGTTEDVALISYLIGVDLASLRTIAINKSSSELNLSNKSLKTLIPPADLSYIGAINLADNAIDGAFTPPRSLPCDSLDVSNNQITDFTIPTELGGMTTLIAKDNLIEHIIYENLSPALIEIDFSGNALGTTEIDLILQEIFDQSNSPSYLYLNGGTNAEPTGGNANANVVALRATGCIVRINTF